MLFKHLKKQMLLPTDEFIINKSVKIRDKEFLIIGITSQNEEIKLWIIMHDDSLKHRDSFSEYDCDNYEELEYERERVKKKSLHSVTKREEMQEDILNSTSNFSINEIEIQGKSMAFTSSSGTCLRDNAYDLCMALQHFVEKGLTVDLFDEYDTNDLMLYTYKQQDGEEFPKIDLSKPLDIKIKIAEDYNQILINKSMTVNFGDILNEKHSFYDEEVNRSYDLYINKVENYDIWEEANKHFDSEHMKKVIKDANIGDEQLQEMKKDYYEFIEQTCPKGMYLAMIEYETEDDVQLNFYTKEFLDAKVEYKEGKCGILFFSPDNKTGPHGLKNRICMLKPVEKDFNRAIDIELFSWYKKIPEEIINL